jgi:methylglyoxal synthase
MQRSATNRSKGRSKSRQRKTIALIAHDGKKAEMVAFVKDHLSFFRHFHIIATSTTGQHVKAAGLKVVRKLSGPQGGDAQIAAEVATGKCDAVIFLRDPLGMHPHDPDISTLMRICDVHNVPLATNPATALLVVLGLSKQ